ncbi:MAG: Maf family protein [Planctomycetaceae bacterium]|nr:Maf family protein [Planctomycetaceae bacterium]
MMTEMTRTMDLILASSSPRRRSLLRQGGIAFRAVDPPLDEPASLQPGMTAAQTAEALAYYKARSVAESHSESLVLGADTVVAATDGTLLGKPAHRLEARTMLQTLSGSRHSVITGVALLGPGPRRLIASDTTFVTMRAMSETEVAAYLDSGEWQGKSGAYAIQETADRFITKIEGSFTNVVGLPMELLDRMLALATTRDAGDPCCRDGHSL